MTATQTARLVAFIREHPGASSLEVTLACRIVNVTGRVSDARAEGHNIVAQRDSEGVFRYRLIEPKPVDRGEQMTLGAA